MIIRADGNAGIGGGHLMRCMTIAKAAADRTGNRDGVCFFCADGDGAEMARAHGFRAQTLHTDYRDPEMELPVWERLWAAADKAAEDGVILVDSYYVTDAYLRTLRTYGRVYLMDDMQNHAYPVDGLINYNVFADRVRYNALYSGEKTQLLLGEAYVPLRRQFKDVEYGTARRVQNVLITTGAGDADNLAGAVLDIIERPELQYHVLVGRFSPHFEEWRRRAREKSNLQVHYDVQDMAGLMKRCDLAVTAAGSTVYELAAVGVPLICFSYAENQELLAEYIGRKHIAGYAGAWHLDAGRTAERIRLLFDGLCEDAHKRQGFCAAERALVDGRGAERLAAALCGNGGISG